MEVIFHRSLQQIMQGIRLVTFDVTNTLLKFRVPPWQYYTVVARDHGFKGTEDEVKARFHNSYKFMWQKYPNFGKSNMKWEKWWQEVVKSTFKGQLSANADVGGMANKLINEYKTSKCWCVADGTNKLLNLLRNHRVSIGIISNFDPRLYDILHNTTLNNSFDFIITSYEIGYSKPDVRIFESAIDKCKTRVKQSECLHIGDDLKKDYMGARAAGWHALLITQNKTETPPAREHIFKNLDDLSSVIEQNLLKL